MAVYFRFPRGGAGNRSFYLRVARVRALPKLDFLMRGNEFTMSSELWKKEVVCVF